MAGKEKRTRPRKPPAPAAELDIARAIYNLHDLFLSAALLKTLMVDARMYLDATRIKHEDESVQITEFTRSPRGRLERLWVTFLVVLVEAWERAAQSVRGKISSLTNTDRLDALLQQKDRLAKLRDVRHYMAHRDVRDNSDPGRYAHTADELGFCLELHDELHRVLSAAVDWANPILDEAWQREKHPPDGDLGGWL
jgi:hypothetical protein